jgi:hypothetical protein
MVCSSGGMSVCLFMDLIWITCSLIVVYDSLAACMGTPGSFWLSSCETSLHEQFPAHPIFHIPAYSSLNTHPITCTQFNLSQNNTNVVSADISIAISIP